jgi:hypothetical protein
VPRRHEELADDRLAIHAAAGRRLSRCTEVSLPGHPGRPGRLADIEHDAAKLASLKYLGHWIGDIHQPLHVSFADDRGGNFIRESGPCVNILHTVWEAAMTPRPETNLLICHGVLAPRARWRARVVFY